MKMFLKSLLALAMIVSATISVGATQLNDSTILNGSEISSVPGEEEPTSGTVTTADQLKAAVANGGTIVLGDDIELTETLVVNKSVTFDGNEHSITIKLNDTNKGRAFLIQNTPTASTAIDVTFTDVEINAVNRAINVMDGNVNLTIDNCVLTTEGGSSNERVVNFGGSGDNITVTITDSEITAKDSSDYGILTFNPVKMNINNTTISGYASLYFKGDCSYNSITEKIESTNALGADGSTVDITNSSVTLSENPHNGISNAFGTIVFEADNIKVNVNKSTISGTATGDQYQVLFLENSYYLPDNFDVSTPNIVTVYNGSTLIADASQYIATDSETNIIIIKDVTSNVEISTDYLAEGYELIETSEGYISCNHSTVSLVNAKDATCTEKGYTGDEKCETCGKVIKAGTEIAAKEHTLKEIKEVPATCTEKGTKAYFECEVCGEAWFDKEMTKEINAEEDLVIKALGHTEVKVEAKAPTCTETGLTEGTKCSVCGEVIKVQEVVKALGHTYKEGKCTVCGEKDPDYVEPELNIEVENLPTVDATKPVEEVTVGVDKKETEEVLNTTVEEIIENVTSGEEVVGVSSEVATVISTAVQKEDDITVTTEVVVKPVEEKDVAEKTVTLIAEEAGKAKVVQYLDLSVLMNVEVNGQTVVKDEEVTQLAKPMTFTVAIPEELKEVEEGYTRTYFIIRVHDGKTEKLPVKVNADGTLTFSTDKFSNYALAYEDTLKVSTQTGDNAPVMMYAAMTMMAAAALVVLKKKESLVK